MSQKRSRAWLESLCVVGIGLILLVFAAPLFADGLRMDARAGVPIFSDPVNFIFGAISLAALYLVVRGLSEIIPAPGPPSPKGPWPPQTPRLGV